MHPTARTGALVAGLVGGASWVAHLFVDAGTLSVVGSVLLGVAVALVGASVARLTWLAVVAALGSVALAWAMLEVARDLGDVRVVEGVLGAGAALLVALSLLRRPASTSRPPGNHRG